MPDVASLALLLATVAPGAAEPAVVSAVPPLAVDAAGLELLSGPDVLFVESFDAASFDPVAAPAPSLPSAAATFADLLDAGSFAPCLAPEALCSGGDLAFDDSAAVVGRTVGTSVLFPGSGVALDAELGPPVSVC